MSDTNEDPKALQEQFQEILREKNISSNASWEYALKVVGNDSRFAPFRTHPQRKQMFNAYKVQRAKEEKEEQRLRTKRAKENLEKFLQSSDKVTSSLRYRAACDLFRDLDVWKQVQDADRREIFEDAIVMIAKREKEEAKQLRKRNMKVLASILDAMPQITYKTTWQEAQQLLLDNPTFSEDAQLLGMDKEDALIVFEDHIRSLEAEEEEDRRREAKRKTRQERKNREAFIQFLDELHSCGKLTSMSKWMHLFHDIPADPRFTNMLRQNFTGSTPLDLFKFYVEDLKARYEDEQKIIRDILKEKNFVMSLTTTFYDFAHVLSQDERSANLDGGNVKMIYDKLIEREREKEKERLKEEAKQRKKLETLFCGLLAKIEPTIDDRTKWSDIRPLICNDDAFDAVPTEEDRIDIFKKYVHTLEESCSHHHSKSKKSSKKRETDGRGNGKPLQKALTGHSHSPSPAESNHTYDDHPSRTHRHHHDKHRSRHRSNHRSRSRSRSPYSQSDSDSLSHSYSSDDHSSRYSSKRRSHSKGKRHERSPSSSSSAERYERPSHRHSKERERYKHPYDDKKQRMSKREDRASEAPRGNDAPGASSSGLDDLEELEKQRRLLLQQLEAARH